MRLIAGRGSRRVRASMVEGRTQSLRLKRCAAFLLDSIAIGVYAASLALVALGLGAGAGGGLDAAFSHPLGGHVLRFATLTGPIVLGLALFESSSWAATPGKRLMSLQVSTTEGQCLSFGRAFSRNLMKLLPWELSHAAVHHVPGWPANIGNIPSLVGVVLWIAWGIGSLYLAFLFLDPVRGPLYDRALGTRVSIAEMRPEPSC